MYAQIEGNEIKLYGRIWYNDGPYVINQISKMLAKAKEDVHIHLHTPGGSVIDGNLIYNAIASAKANVTIYIDGLAASMGSIIMLASKKIVMAENAYIMIHAPSGYQEGNAKDFEKTAKLLRSMEGNFIKKLSARWKDSDSEVKDLMDGDNWFDADQALDAGLVDETFDPVIEESNLNDYQDVKMCAQLFEAYDRNPEDEPRPPKKKKEPKQQEMKLDARSLEALGLDANATDAEINAAIEAQNKKIKDMESKSKKEHEAKCEKLVADAITAGKILAGEKDQWLDDAKANYELTERMIGKLTGKKTLVAQEEEFQNDLEGRKDWTLADWRKKDPAGLLEIKRKDPKAYEAIWAKK